MDPRAVTALSPEARRRFSAWVARVESAPHVESVAKLPGQLPLFVPKQIPLFEAGSPMPVEPVPLDPNRVVDGPMRGLTLWRPWPQSIHGVVHRPPRGYGDHCGINFQPGPKRIENRGWHPPADLVGRCWLAIHSGRHFSGDAVPWLRERGWDFDGPFPESCITGVALLESQHGECDRLCDRCDAWSDNPLADEPFYMDSVGWVLAGAVPLIDPVPCKGAMGLWRLSPDVEARVRAEYFRSIEDLASQLPPGPRMAQPLSVTP